MIADLYTPILLLCWLYYWQKESLQRRKSRLKALLLGVIAVYSLMLLDNYLSFFLSLALDYSSHSAIALLFVVALSAYNKALFVVAPLSLFAYFYLLWFLDYHSVADMSATSLLLLPIFIYLHRKGI